MHSMLYVTVECPSVRLSVPLSSVFINIVFITFSPRAVNTVKCP